MLSWDEFVVIGLALALGGLMKGVTGMGLPLVTVPVMASFLGVERAVLTMVIPSAVLNAYQVWIHRDQRQAVPEVSRVLIAGAIGVAGGAWILYFASDRSLATGLALWIIAYVLFRMLHPSFALSIGTRMRWSPAIGLLSGALQAATGISAPIIAAYMGSLRLAPRAYVFAVSAPFGMFAAAHFVFLTGIGAYSGVVVAQSVLAILPALAFIPVGGWLRRFITPKQFDVIVRLTLVVLALRLLRDAWLPATLD